MRVFLLFGLFAFTSYFDFPPISSAYPFAADRSFCYSIVKDAHTLTRSFTIMRDNARLHTPSFSTLSGHFRSRSCHEARSSHSLFFGFLISSMWISGSPWDGFLRMEEILLSTNGRFLSDPPCPNRLFSSSSSIYSPVQPSHPVITYQPPNWSHHTFINFAFKCVSSSPLLVAFVPTASFLST